MVWFYRRLGINAERIGETGAMTGVKGEMLCTYNESGTFITSCNNISARPDQIAVCETYSHTHNLNDTYNDRNIMKHVHNFMSSWSRPALRSVSKIAHHVYPGNVVNKINFAHKFRLEISKPQPTCLSLSKMITTLDTPYRFET